MYFLNVIILKCVYNSYLFQILNPNISCFTDIALSMCLLLECPLNRSRFIKTKDGISVFLDLISGTNPTQKELATNTLLSFQYSKDLLEVCINYYFYFFLILYLLFSSYY